MIQQIFLKHGIPEGAVKIKSRIVNYENMPSGGVKATLDDGTEVFGDALVGGVCVCVCACVRSCACVFPPPTTHHALTCTHHRSPTTSGRCVELDPEGDARAGRRSKWLRRFRRCGRGTRRGRGAQAGSRHGLCARMAHIPFPPHHTRCSPPAPLRTVLAWVGVGLGGNPLWVYLHVGYWVLDICIYLYIDFWETNQFT